MGDKVELCDLHVVSPGNPGLTARSQLQRRTYPIISGYLPNRHDRGSRVVVKHISGD